MITEILTQLGLSTEEADLYQALLTHGPQTAVKLGKTSPVKRTYVYRIASELVKKGLVAIQKIDRTTIFTPLSPDYLLAVAEQQKQASTQAQTALEGILPSLKEQFQTFETKPVVSYYEGVAGIKKIFQSIYAPKSEPVYGCVDLEAADAAVPDKIVSELIPLRIKNKLQAISIVADSPAAREVHSKDAQSLRHSQLIDKKEYPLPAEIDVYEDKIALLSFAKGKFAGILIQNQDLATSLKSLFKLAFKKLK